MDLTLAFLPNRSSNRRPLGPQGRGPSPPPPGRTPCAAFHVLAGTLAAEGVLKNFVFFWHEAFRVDKLTGYDRGGWGDCGID